MNHTHTFPASKFWDRMAQSSDKTEIVLDRNGADILRRSNGQLRPSDKVLDLGCGPGSLSLSLAPKVQELHGLDISSGMVNVARRKAQAQGIENAHFAQGDLHTATLREESFDAILAFNVLPYLADLQVHLSKLGRLLKPGGLFLSSTACMADRPSLVRSLQWLVRGLRTLPPMQHFRSSSLRAEIEAAGFRIKEWGAVSQLPEFWVAAVKA